jgi:hypothetical protein
MPGRSRSSLASTKGILEYPARVVRRTKTRYCLQTTVAGRVFHRRGPVGPFSPVQRKTAPGRGRRGPIGHDLVGKTDREAVHDDDDDLRGHLAAEFGRGDIPSRPPV